MKEIFQASKVTCSSRLRFPAGIFNAALLDERTLHNVSLGDVVDGIKIELSFQSISAWDRRDI